MLKKFSYNSLDDLFAAIGYGGITTLKALGRFREEIQKIVHQKQAAYNEQQSAKEQDAKSQPAEKDTADENRKAAQGIVVEGMDNCLVRFAKCCSPVPGDDIVGFITRGFGVSVHRSD